MNSDFRRQQGVALVISLMMLVAITLLAVSAMRTTTMQEKMASNLNDREIAKQIAESTVRVVGAQLPPLPGAAWFTQAIPAPEVGVPDRWSTDAGWANAGTVTVQVNGVDYTGQFIVENMGFWADRERPSCKVSDPLCESQTYRITARSAPTPGRASVILQAIWRM